MNIDKLMVNLITKKMKQEMESNNMNENATFIPTFDVEKDDTCVIVSRALSGLTRTFGPFANKKAAEKWLNNPDNFMMTEINIMVLENPED